MSTAQPPETSEARELRLVDSVELKILRVANNEARLQQLLDIYLIPLLLKAESDHEPVRTKVINICMKLKTFIEPPGIVLPVDKLLDQYKSTGSIIVRHLDVTFIQHSTPRLDKPDRVLLIPQFLSCISTDGLGQTQNSSILFNLFLSVLPDLPLPPRGSPGDEKLRETAGLSDPGDAAFVARWLGRILLLKLPAAENPSLDDLVARNRSLERDELVFLRVANPKDNMVYARLLELKLKIVAFLSGGAFNASETLLPAIYAAGATDSALSSAGEELLRRADVPLESTSVVTDLFAAHSNLPTAYRIRILALLTRSEKAARMVDPILRVVDVDLPKPGGDVSHLTPTSSLERAKLHRAVFQFLNWVCKNASPDQAFPLGPVLLDGARRYVEFQGWPVPRKASADAVALRCTAYELMGAILTKNTSLPSEQQLSTALFLFTSLSEDPTNDAVVSIDGTLSSLASEFRRSSDGGNGMGAFIFSLLLQPHMVKSADPPAVRSTRHAVVKWANRCYEYRDSNARWINILAVAGRRDERGDVVEEGRKGLDPWTHYAHSKEEFEAPSWRRLVSAFFATWMMPPDRLYPGGRLENAMDVDPPVVDGPDVDGIDDPGEPPGIFRNFPGDAIGAYPVALDYCKQMLLLAALGKDFQLGPDWESSLDARMRNDQKSRAKVVEYLRSQPQHELGAFLSACLAGALCGRRDITEECLGCLVAVASLSPQAAIQHVAGRAADLLELVPSTIRRTQTLAAQAFGMLGAHPENDDAGVGGFLEKLGTAVEEHRTAVGAHLSAVEGAVLAHAHLCSRLAYYGRGALARGAGGIDRIPHLDLLLDKGVQHSLRSTAVDALGQLWTAGLRPGHGGGWDGKKNAGTIGALVGDVKAGNEGAIWALGRLAVAVEEEDPDEPDRALSSGPVSAILSELFGLHELRRVEVHFATGEAVAAAVARWESLAVQLALDVHPPSESASAAAAAAVRPPKRSARVKAVLDRLFADCKSTKPSLLKASGIWLFCVVQYCSELEEVASRLREAQAAFMRLLSARDELVQETASRGLSLVYEKGDADIRQDLVRDLVSAFTGTGPQIKVDGDTELFEPGALATGDGQSVTSYRDIVSLAQEVGDQSLVYKFMSLASNAAAWSTRSAFGRFGLSSILSDSDIDPKLYPKLFRYRFDPNPNVQRSMNDIWKAVVRDPGAVLDAHFDAIMADLLRSILGKEWRVREASCAAIADLVSGRPFEKYEKYYRDIWRVGAKVLDDIKGSVRHAALQMCAELINTLLRQLEESPVSSSTGGAADMMREAVPFLLSDSGIESGVEDVKVFATIAVLKICKRGGNVLKSFIPAIVPQFLGLLSTIEPEQINYGYQRVDAEGREAIDRFRSAAVRASPISEAIEECLRHVDEEVFAQLAPRLLECARNALGMPTKVGCARVFVTLFTRHTHTVRPMAAEFLALAAGLALEANDEVGKGYATAAAYIFRSATDGAQADFLGRFVSLYFSAEDEKPRRKVADAVVAVSEISPDHFVHHEGALLPFAYLASHDTDEYARKAFAKVWAHQTGSTGRTVARFADEICALVRRALDAPKWDLRHTGALAAGAMVDDVVRGSDEAGGRISDRRAALIWPVLERSLALKTFAGKEAVLKALPLFVEKARSLWEADPAIAHNMKKIAIREAKRNNDAYKVHAYGELWKFAKARPDLDLLREVRDTVKDGLDAWLENEDTMDVDGGGDDKGRAAAREQLAAAAFEAVARGWSPEAMRADRFGVLRNVIAMLGDYLHRPRFAAVKRQVWYSCVFDLTEAAKDAPAAGTKPTADVLAAYLASLDLERAGESGVEVHRIARAKAALALAEAVQGKVFGPDVDYATVRTMVGKAMEGERSQDVRRILASARKALGDDGL